MHDQITRMNIHCIHFTNWFQFTLRFFSKWKMFIFLQNGWMLVLHLGFSCAGITSKRLASSWNIMRGNKKYIISLSWKWKPFHRETGNSFRDFDHHIIVAVKHFRELTLLRNAHGSIIVIITTIMFIVVLVFGFGLAGLRCSLRVPCGV